VNSVRFNAAAVATVNTGGNLVIATGGILETSTVGANAVSINNNTITSGNGQDLIVIQNSVSGTMTIASAVVNNGAASIGLTKSGAGALALNGANTYTGATILNGGTTTVTNTSSLGANSAVTLSAGAPWFSATRARRSICNRSEPPPLLRATRKPAANAIDGNIGTRWERLPPIRSGSRST